ncbi:hypothetical protein Bca52824_042259 [Brassica carinata]|uniref:AB hydrolase-1 domain-containing protein n=1 Tax=Brassica carinata TaxID=52824 RepID=A0A8X7UX73_BRACI|nr:hypothetical protein Bca52824_042259 [Brassica carinata]
MGSATAHGLGNSETAAGGSGLCVTAVDLASSGINMTRLEEIQTLEDYCKPLLEFLSSLCSDDEKVSCLTQETHLLMLFLNQDVESKEGNGEGEPEAVCARPWALPRRVDLVQTENAVEAAGHCVTAVDLAASGINMTRLDEIPTLVDYSKPLLDILSSLGSDEDKVILVAHSMGGIPVALAADIFPSKISAIVFVTSFMPDTRNPPAYVLENGTSQMDWLDTSMAKYAYQLSPLEDLVLATMLVRVNPVVTNNLAGTKALDYQRWMISNFPVKEVMEIKDADHMAMFSKPQELCARRGIANKYGDKPVIMAAS